MLFSTNEAGHLVAFCDEKIKDFPADETWADDENLLSG